MAYTRGRFLWTGLGFTCASPITPVPNSRFSPVFGVLESSFVVSLPEDLESSAPPPRTDVASGSELAGVEAGSEAGGEGSETFSADGFTSVGLDAGFS